MAAILRIEHPVADFAAWKRAFDSDPVGRRRGGVRRYRVMRPCDDSNRAMIDLEFGSAADAHTFLAGLRDLWGRVDVMSDPQARVVELIESRQLATSEVAA